MRTTRQFTSHQELDFVNHSNQKTFYKYSNRALGKQHSAHQLVDTDGKSVTDDVIATDILNREFANNSAPSAGYSNKTLVDISSDLAFNSSFLDTHKALASSTSSLPA